MPFSELEIQTLEENFRRVSFDKRFCDDLSEFILQFLPIKDKFRFECVSKQFQRTVYRRHQELLVSDHMTDLISKASELLSKDMRFLENILKKLSNIKSVKSSFRLKNSEIDLIIKYCNHLNEYETGFRLRLERSRSFLDPYLPLSTPILTSLKFKDSSYLSIIKSLVNIQEINPLLDDNSIEFCTKIHSKALKKVSANLANNDINYFKSFINENKSITHLSIKYSSYETIDSIFGVISQLNQLISLRLENIEFKSLTDCIKQLSLNCLNLKSLSLKCCKITEDLKTNDIMSKIKRFKHLKRFEFEFNSPLGECYQFEDYFINSIESGFKQLTHLSIGFYYNYFVLNETFIQNIVKYSPNLQKLIIQNPIRVTERTAGILSRLSKLETLELNTKISKAFCDSFKKEINKKCRKIKSIKV